jgi:hypothetical protein
LSIQITFLIFNKLKTILFLILTNLGLAYLGAQTLPMKDGKIIYQDVVLIEGKSKDEIMSHLELWMANTFKDSRAVKELVDKNSGTIVGNGIFSNICHKNSFGIKACNSNVRFQITFEVKENRFRYTVTNFDHYFLPREKNEAKDGGALEQDKAPGGLNAIQNKVWKAIKEETDLRVKSLITSMTNSFSESKDDW